MTCWWAKNLLFELGVVSPFRLWSGGAGTCQSVSISKVYLWIYHPILYMQLWERTEPGPRISQCVKLDGCRCGDLFLPGEISWTGSAHAVKQLSVAHCPKVSNTNILKCSIPWCLPFLRKHFLLINYLYFQILCIHLQRAFMSRTGEPVKLQVCWISYSYELKCAFCVFAFWALDVSMVGARILSFVPGSIPLLWSSEWDGAMQFVWSSAKRTQFDAATVDPRNSLWNKKCECRLKCAKKSVKTSAHQSPQRIVWIKLLWNQEMSTLSQPQNASRRLKARQQWMAKNLMWR